MTSMTRTNTGESDEAGADMSTDPGPPADGHGISPGARRRIGRR